MTPGSQHPKVTVPGSSVTSGLQVSFSNIAFGSPHWPLTEPDSWHLAGMTFDVYLEMRRLSHRGINTSQPASSSDISVLWEQFQWRSDFHSPVPNRECNRFRGKERVKCCFPSFRGSLFQTLLWANGPAGGKQQVFYTCVFQKGISKALLK